MAQSGSDRLRRAPLEPDRLLRAPLEPDRLLRAPLVPDRRLRAVFAADRPVRAPFTAERPFVDFADFADSLFVDMIVGEPPKKIRFPKQR